MDIKGHSSVFICSLFLDTHHTPMVVTMFVSIIMYVIRDIKTIFSSKSYLRRYMLRVAGTMPWAHIIVMINLSLVNCDLYVAVDTAMYLVNNKISKNNELYINPVRIKEGSIMNTKPKNTKKKVSSRKEISF
jgi:uncharacterized membrane protein